MLKPKQQRTFVSIRSWLQSADVVSRAQNSLTLAFKRLLITDLKCASNRSEFTLLWPPWTLLLVLYHLQQQEQQLYLQCLHETILQVQKSKIQWNDYKTRSYF